MADEPADQPPAQSPPEAPPAQPSPDQPRPLPPPPPASPPTQPSPPAYPPPPYQPPPPAPPPQYPPPQYPPAPPGPSTPQQLGWAPPPYVPPPPRPKGPHGQPVWNGVECASWASRVGAWFLDLLFAFAPIVVGIVLAAAGSGNDGLEALGGLTILAGMVWAYFVYAPLFMARGGERNGQTLGKQLAGIRVVRDGGEPLSFGYGLLRELVVKYLLIGFVGGLFFLPPLLDYLWPLWDDTNRSLHDMVVSTHVVRADAT